MFSRDPRAGQDPVRLPERGHPLSEFLDDFPTVKREQAKEAIAAAGHRLVEAPELVHTATRLPISLNCAR
jgi:hypothetical protein